MKGKTVIWSLFDSETAITQELNNDKYEVYSIGLSSLSALINNFIKIDLSKKSCIKKLAKLPAPDIIFASPPCETWVVLSSGALRFYKRNFNEYNLYWQNNFKPNDFTKEQRVRRLQGQKTAYWTYKIIETFKPKMWCIENGRSSLIFKYLFKFHGLQGFKNYLNYSSYDSNFSQKPTIFFSNKKMVLKRFFGSVENLNKISINKSLINKHKNDWKDAGFNSITAYCNDKYNILKSYTERSVVPIGVYRHVLRYYEGKEQLTIKY